MPGPRIIVGQKLGFIDGGNLEKLGQSPINYTFNVPIPIKCVKERKIC